MSVNTETFPVAVDSGGVEGPPAAEQSAEFGGHDIEKVPLDKIIDLPVQMRRRVDEADLEELKESIRPENAVKSEGGDLNGVVHFNLVNSVTINVLDADHIEQYIRDHAEYYGLEIDPTEAISQMPTHNGQYYVRVAGHMRGRAMRELCEEYKIDLSRAQTSATVTKNVAFIDANRTQNIENRHVEVSPVDTAEAIALYYQWLQKHDLPSDTRTIADYFGYSSEKVRTALRFVTAPDSIKAFVDNGLSYTNVVNLVRLREAYVIFYRKRAAARAEEVAHAQLQDWATQSMQDYFETTVRNRLAGKSAGQISRAIEAQVKELRATEFYVMDELFFVDEQAQQAERRRAVRQEMGDMAVMSLRHLLRQGDLSVGMADELQRLVDEAKRVASHQSDADRLDEGLF